MAKFQHTAQKGCFTPSMLAFMILCIFFWVGIFSCVSAQEPVDTTDVLPIELMFFDVKQTNKNVVVAWQTLEEINSKEFVVEQSSNGYEWKPAFTVISNGVPSFYERSYFLPYPGLNYFRLVHYDNDGSEQIFNPVVLHYIGRFTVHNIAGRRIGEFTDLSVLPKGEMFIINGRLTTLF